jgi:uncharacterized membrane protein YedE/YeeE
LPRRLDRRALIALHPPSGVIDPAASFYTTSRFTPLAYVLGGGLFGFGMLLAGGCRARGSDAGLEPAPGGAG